MTFYWWSHWFWITLWSNFIISHIVIVHTYPSQESMLQYNSNQQMNGNNLITRLYQSSTATWKINVPSHYAKSETLEKLKLQHIERTEDEKPSTPPTSKLDEHIPKAQTRFIHDENEYYYDYDATEEKNDKFNLEEIEEDLERKEDISLAVDKQEPDLDVKRSAEDIGNKSDADQKSQLKLLINSTSSTLLDTNNYTNFTDKRNLNRTNTPATTWMGVIATTTTTTTNSSDNRITNTTTKIIEIESNTNATTQLPQVPSTPKIVKVQMGNLEWLNSITGQLPTTHATTVDVTPDGNEEPHKIPFTLENVNKPEDLRRDEGEHRTRKSKGLSAEYKVNRYINYSSDTKNLLTRSAATTVNEYDSEESNISSEALSVQRAYFMDVGAISAICLTVFGVCCTFATVGIVLYRRRFLNKPQALSEPDSSVYIDDSTMRVSDNSDEMYSLDNDSFLNSLEAMTIQNYWTDTVKHTKL